MMMMMMMTMIMKLVVIETMMVAVMIPWLDGVSRITTMITMINSSNL